MEKMEKTEKVKDDLSKQLVKSGIYLVALLAISGISVGVGLFEDMEDVTSMLRLNLSSVIRVVIMVCFVMAAAGFVRYGLKRVKPKHKRTATVVTIAASLTQYAAAIIMICWGLTLLGVNVGTIFASIGLVALIVGFGAESLIADVITGVFMLFENQYNVDDIIEVNGFRGTVTRIGIRITAISDSGGNIKIINNSAMVNILNRSTVGSKAVCDIGIPYEADLEAVEGMLPEILQNIYENHRDAMLDSPRYEGVQELGESAVILRVVASVNEKDLFRVTRILNRELYLALKKNKVEIPYKQIDIHAKN